jgi:Xaa-Pro aminopeptidase
MSAFIEIPKSEFVKRVKRTQKALEERKLDALIAFSSYQEREGHVAYLTNEHIQLPPMLGEGLGYSAALVTADGGPFLFSPQCYQEHMVVGVESANVGPNMIKELTKTLKEKKLIGKKIGIAGTDVVPYAFMLKLNEAVKGTSFIDSNDILESQRMIKSEAELRIMENAARIGMAGVEASWEAAQPGKTENEVNIKTYEALMEAGADFVARIRTNAGKWATIMRWPMATGTRIKEGDTIFMDYVGFFKNYGWDLGQTWVVGKATADQKRTITDGLNATRLCVESAKPGVTPSDIYTSVSKYFEDKGYKPSTSGFFHPEGYSPFGHGIGIDIVEKPFVNPTDKTVLKPGMVMCLEPGLKSTKKNLYCQIEDTVVITESGARLLSHNYKFAEEVLA